ncbi:ParB N-terminal domain-containing protein [bacterium]|nr:ParB N-terminal domain-containing protein [bacterium]
MSDIGFQMRTVELRVSDLYPLFPRKEEFRGSNVFRKIVSSIKELGLIEPLVVIEQQGHYFIKDGYLRWCALQELGFEKVECLIGTDMDVYTYNKRVNALTPIQTHRMIERAIKHGVEPDKIADALNVSQNWVKLMEKLITGITPEVIEKLKQRVVGKKIFEELKKVSADRQMEILQMIEAADDYSVKYVRALVLATNPKQCVKKNSTRKKVDPKVQEEFAGQLRKIEVEFKNASTIFRDNMFDLVKLSAYIRNLLTNQEIRRFLDQHYPDILVDFERIAKDTSLNV